MTEEESQAFMQESIEGLSDLLQVLVVALGKGGQLDTGEYARLLTDFGQQHHAPGSMQTVLFDRMLMQLVDQPAVLKRRMALRVVAQSPVPAPTGTSPDHVDE